MPSAEELIARRRTETARAAHALVDDLGHFRRVLGNRELSAGDVRRLSAQLRRLLVDGDLKQVAAPRLRGLLVLAPQLKFFHHANEQSPLELYSGGQLSFANMHFADVVFGTARMRGMGDHKPDQTVELSADQFRDQRVICFRGKWVTRGEAIKHIANSASGVHSGEAKTASGKMLEEMGGYAGFQLSDGSGTLVMNIQFAAADPKPWDFDGQRMDLAMMQVMSTAQYLVSSPMVLQLEELIQGEAIT